MVSQSYILASGVNVRLEKFGLLFYDYRGPRLYFLPSRDWVPAEFFDGRKSAGELVETLYTRHGWSRDLISEQIGRILRMLEVRGLIHEQSVC
ncbi:MAG: mycofactocin biosynthesis chaperone MftB [Desulfomonilaceae bacterium]|nr:mycofactocin biosynthesis chaperone MftB [Syntrophaceae bacterium]